MTEPAPGPRFRWVRRAFWATLVIGLAGWVWVARLPPPDLPGSRKFFEGEVEPVPNSPGPGERLVAREIWKDDDHGYRAWERLHFAFNNYVRIWVRWDESAAGVSGLAEREEETLQRRTGGGALSLFGRAGLGVPVHDDSPGFRTRRVWRVLYGREPDLYPWYDNPIHRLLAPVDTVDFEIAESAR